MNIEKVKQRLHTLVEQTRGRAGSIVADNSVEALALGTIRNLESEVQGQEQFVVEAYARQNQAIEMAERLAALCAQLNDKLAAGMKALDEYDTSGYGLSEVDLEPITTDPDYQAALDAIQQRAVAKFAADLVEAVNSGDEFSNLTEQHVVDFAFAYFEREAE